MGAAREPADVERAMARIEDEAARMGVLVEDLLTLARLDEVADAPHVEVDVAAIARDAVDDARATAPEREIALDAPRRARVTGDAAPAAPGARATCCATRSCTRRRARRWRSPCAGADGPVRVEVRDHGPGLPDGRPGRAVRALLARRGRAGARPRGRGARPRDRRGDRRRTRRPGVGGQRARRRRGVRGRAARGAPAGARAAARRGRARARRGGATGLIRPARRRARRRPARRAASSCRTCPPTSSAPRR